MSGEFAVEKPIPQGYFKSDVVCVNALRSYGTYVYLNSVYGGSQQYNLVFKAYSDDTFGVAIRYRPFNGAIVCEGFGVYLGLRVFQNQEGKIVNGGYWVGCNNDTSAQSQTFISYSPEYWICPHLCAENQCKVECASSPNGFCCINHSTTDRLLQVLASS